MFEKFTEKAIDAVKSAQIYAASHNHKEICPEHLLLAILNDSNGIIAKTFSMHKINIDELRAEIIKILDKHTSQKPAEFICFSIASRNIFEKTLEISEILGSTYIKPEHIFLALIDNPEIKLSEILKNKGIDISNIKSMLYNILSAKKQPKIKHPEVFDRRRRNDKGGSILSLIENADSTGIFSRAIAKLSASGYEILGTEQIMLSILEDTDSEASKILAGFGITPDVFSEKLKEISSRQDEFCGRQIIFTPNAMTALLNALDTAKENGTASILPEHIIAGLLKSKKGIAYNILKELNIDEMLLEDKIRKPIENQVNETLYIMRLAKQEARRMGSGIVGSELLLLGIILEANSIAAEVLRDLGVTIKDAREKAAELTGVNDDYNTSEITLSQRAKLILEDAWNIAKSQKKARTSAADLLTAICNQPDSAAMRVLNILGADALEIRQGIKNKLENGGI